SARASVGKRLSHRDNNFPSVSFRLTARPHSIRDKGLASDSVGYAIADPETGAPGVPGVYRGSTTKRKDAFSSTYARDCDRWCGPVWPFRSGPFPASRGSLPHLRPSHGQLAGPHAQRHRSEERRVGKECRSRWWTEQ